MEVRQLLEFVMELYLRRCAGVVSKFSRVSVEVNGRKTQVHCPKMATGHCPDRGGHDLAQRGPQPGGSAAKPVRLGTAGVSGGQL